MIQQEDKQTKDKEKTEWDPKVEGEVKVKKAKNEQTEKNNTRSRRKRNKESGEGGKCIRIIKAGE